MQSGGGKKAEAIVPSDMNALREVSRATLKANAAKNARPCRSWIALMEEQSTPKLVKPNGKSALSSISKTLMKTLYASPHELLK